jgi:hypothetical protein
MIFMQTSPPSRRSTQCTAFENVPAKGSGGAAVPKRQCCSRRRLDQCGHSGSARPQGGRRTIGTRTEGNGETAKRMRSGEGGSVGGSAAVRLSARGRPLGLSIYPCDMTRRRARLRALRHGAREQARAEGTTAVVRPDESGERVGGRAEVSHRRRGTRRSGTGPRSARSLQPGNPGGLRIPESIPDSGMVRGTQKGLRIVRALNSIIGTL